MDKKETIQKSRTKSIIGKTIYVVVISICLFSCFQKKTKDKIITSSKIIDMNQESIATTIIDMEKAALEKLNKGNPSGFLDIYADDITYFDPFQEKRFDGFKSVQAFYKSLEGTIFVEQYEMIDPVVQSGGEIAVLSFNLVSHIGNNIFRERCTEVYKQQPDKQWKIIHSHWSIIPPTNK
ncbi:MAG: nuclear transport factor 2 family protein [Bacteroidales bacterium]|jgi:ketosteroid isomerase-like protein|nr:nuclear transport factor 2 family protein [Bacteroidales bacterium]